MHDHTEGGRRKDAVERMHAGEAQHRDEVRQIDRVGSASPMRTTTSAGTSGEGLFDAERAIDDHDRRNTAQRHQTKATEASSIA